MKVIPCEMNQELGGMIVSYAKTLETEAHRLGNHGLSKEEFYDSGLFRGAIERLRGKFAATMHSKREFCAAVLDCLQQENLIKSWRCAGSTNRFDYEVILESGRVCAIELKGCLDGNNTNIFERPPHAHEFIIWSVCTSASSDPEKNAWSGIHTRLSAEIISRQQRVDGLVIWDMMCATVGRPCPKVAGSPSRATSLQHYHLPPPCIYLMPSTVASARNNPKPTAQSIAAVHFLKLLHERFKGSDDELNYVDFEVENQGPELMRRTILRRNGIVAKASKLIAIQRT